METFFTSDTHFCHDREFVYGPRGFSNINEMNEAIVERWNSVVRPQDIVYHLGDVMLNDNEMGMKYIKQLNGTIHIIKGNHDTNTRIALYNTIDGVDCLNYADVIKIGGCRFYLSHYPTNTANFDEVDTSLKDHLINLYGHTHQQTNFYNDIPYMYHVGVDSHDCYPVNIEQVLTDIREKVEEYKEML